MREIAETPTTEPLVFLPSTAKRLPFYGVAAGKGWGGEPVQKTEFDLQTGIEPRQHHTLEYYSGNVEVRCQPPTDRQPGHDDGPVEFCTTVWILEIRNPELGVFGF